MSNPAGLTRRVVEARGSDPRDVERIMNLVDILRPAVLALRRLGPYALLELLAPGGTDTGRVRGLYRPARGAPAAPRVRGLGAAAPRPRRWGRDSRFAARLGAQ